MRKTGNPARRRTRRPRRTARERVLDVVTQLETAIRHPRAALLGALLGGAVPWFARVLAHDELPAEWSTGSHTIALAMLGIILGCAAFSMLTVYKFGLAAFSGDQRKAVGFVAALEGVMLVSHGMTSAVALGLLIVINAIANGCGIALGRDATLRRQCDDARRVATRAQNRTRSRGESPVASAAAPTPGAVSPPVARTTTARRPHAKKCPIPVVVVTAARPERLALAGEVVEAEFEDAMFS